MSSKTESMGYYAGFGVLLNGTLVYQDEEDTITFARLVKNREYQNGEVVRWTQSIIPNSPTLLSKVDEKTGRLL